MKKSLLNVLLVCLGLTFGMSAHAQLRVKTYVQSGNVGSQDFEGEGLDLTAVVNPESGLFLGVSLSGGENGQDWTEPGGESYFNMTEISIGKSTLSGVTYFGGLTSNKMETWFDGGGYTADIDGIFLGVGTAQPFAGGAVSVSGSVMTGRLHSNLTGYYCDSYNSPWFSSTFCGETNEWHESGVVGLAYSVAYAYPVSDWVTVGVEHKNRSFSYDGIGGQSETIEVALTRFFLDMSFR